MSDIVKIAFAPLAAAEGGALVVFAGPELALGGQTAARLKDARLGDAASTMAFKAKAMSALDIVRPSGLAAERLLVVGVAAKAGDKPLDFASLGGFVAGRLAKAKRIAVLFEAAGRRVGRRSRRRFCVWFSRCAATSSTNTRARSPTARTTTIAARS